MRLGLRIRSVHWSWWAIVGLSAGIAFQLTPLLQRGTDDDAGLSHEAHERGDTLPAIDFFPVSGWSEAFFDWRGRSLAEIADSKCVALGFFASTCPACERLASNWSRRDTIRLGTETVPFFWVGRTDDHGAVEWIDRHALENSFLAKPAGFRGLRVRFVPQLYVVSGAGVLLYRGLLNRRRLAELRDTGTEYLENCG